MHDAASTTPGTGADTALAASTVRTALGITFAASVVTVSGVSLIYPVLPLIAADFKVSESDIGLTIAAYTLPAVVLAPVFGVLADLKGRRWLLIAGLFLFALAGAGAALASSFSWLLVWRVAQGVGMSAITPLTIVLISDLVHEDRELKGQGHKVVIDRVAMIALPVLGGTLAAISWRLAVLMYLAVLPVAVAAWMWMPETKATGMINFRRYFGETAAALREPRIHLGLAVGFLRFFLDYGMFIYLPLLLSFRSGASAAAIGGVLAICGLGAIVTAATVNWIVRQQTVEVLLALAFLACGLALCLMVVDKTIWSVTAAAFVFGLGNGLISPLQKSLLTRNAPIHLRGGVISVDRVVQQIAKSLAPGLIGLLLLFAKLETVFLLLGGFGIMGALMLVCANAQRRPAAATPSAGTAE